MHPSSVPAALAHFTVDLANELAQTYGDQVVYPRQTIVDQPVTADRRFPGWSTPMLLLAIENQGVCAWGVPLDSDDKPPVLVGGELSDGSPGTVHYAAGVDGYVSARRWDAACLSTGLSIQAQAEPVDPATLAYLRSRYHESSSTSGWPGNVTYRFETDAVRIMLWAGTDQCDWWISGTEADRLADVTSALPPYSDLRTLLWSNDIAGQALLDQLRPPADSSSTR